MAQSTIAKCMPALEKLAGQQGFELVDAEIAKEGQSRYLRIYIDKPGGITLDDCEVYHRACMPLVEHVDYDFLEVCSPGLDRPLKTQKDFDRHAGDLIEVRLYKPVGGQKIFEGRLCGLSDSVLTLETDTQTCSFPLTDVSLARPIILVTEEDLADADGIEVEADDDRQTN